jgi:hypothetical protein
MEYVISLVSYIMRFFPPSPNVVSRITKAEKCLLDPHHLLPIPLLLGEPASHPYLSAPTPYHPIPYSLLQLIICDAPYGDNWNHMLVGCRQLTRLLLICTPLIVTSFPRTDAK